MRSLSEVEHELFVAHVKADVKALGVTFSVLHALQHEGQTVVVGKDDKCVGLRVAADRHSAVPLEELRGSANVGGLEGEAADSQLTEIWEDLRLSCPKRTTIGRFVLGTLAPPWQDYIDFHLNKLGCRFCRGNLEDLAEESKEKPKATRDRIFQSTVGFLRA